MPHEQYWAFDYASTRRTDSDGHLHIATARLSRACVSEYLGAEIPNYRNLGLDAARIYRLWRRPDEMRRGAHTLEGKPLLTTHRPVTARDHASEIVAGALRNISFDGEFLNGGATVWVGEAIAGIENDTQRQISCAYSYDAEMRPGVTPDGQHYDGIMINLNFNHAALVPLGRMGAACSVGDSAISTTRKTKMDDDDFKYDEATGICTMSIKRLAMMLMRKKDGAAPDSEEPDDTPAAIAEDRALSRVARDYGVTRSGNLLTSPAHERSRAAMFPNASRLK